LKKFSFTARNPKTANPFLKFGHSTISLFISEESQSQLRPVRSAGKRQPSQG
jgi:hypothetical protein